VRKSDSERDNHFLLERHRQFRAAADVVAEAWMAFPEVRAIALIGSVAGPLWKEVPRFREYRRSLSALSDEDWRRGCPKRFWASASVVQHSRNKRGNHVANFQSPPTTFLMMLR
jgi:alpha-D-ribose 1-methylphosphonate 5-triphosphate diphosphatase PhnM